MANRIQLRRNTTNPSGGDLLAGELGLNTSTGELFVSTDGSTVQSLGDGNFLPLTGGDLTGNLKITDATLPTLTLEHDGNGSLGKIDFTRTGFGATAYIENTSSGFDFTHGVSVGTTLFQGGPGSTFTISTNHSVFNAGNYSFDIDQTVGATEDNYVLTYDDASGLISLEAVPSGSSYNIVDNSDATFLTVDVNEQATFTSNIFAHTIYSDEGVGGSPNFAMEQNGVRKAYIQWNHGQDKLLIHSDTSIELKPNNNTRVVVSNSSVDIGLDDSVKGLVNIYGDSTTSGAELRLYNAGGEDTNLIAWGFEAHGDSLFVESDSSQSVAFVREDVSIRRIDVGIDGSRQGKTYLYGDVDGGIVRLYNGNADDTNVDYWQIEADASLLIKRDGTTAITINENSGVTLAQDLTVQGSFTSVGIDDNASAERLQVGNNNTAFGASSGAGTYGLENRDDTGIFYISGSDSEILGSNIRLYGDAHATKANDFEIRADATDVVAYDHSTSTLNFIVTNLQQNGSAIGGGGIGGSIANDQVAVGSSTTDEIEGFSHFTYDGTTLAFGSGASGTVDIRHGGGTAGYVGLYGGNGNFNGGNVIVYGSTETFNGGDIAFASDSLFCGLWDESAGEWTFSTGSGVKTLALTLDSSQNATFAGDIIVGSDTATAADIEIRANATTSTHLYFYENAAIGGYLQNNPTNNAFYVGAWTGNSLILQGGATDTLTLDSSQNATFEGTVSVNGSNVQIVNAAPSFQLYESDQGLDKKRWSFLLGGGALRGRALTDDGSTQPEWLQVTTTGTGASLEINNILLRTGASTTALTLDSSQNATFAGDVTIAPGSSAADLFLNAGAGTGANIYFQENGTSDARIQSDTSGQLVFFVGDASTADFYMQSTQFDVRDKAIINVRDITFDSSEAVTEITNQYTGGSSFLQFESDNTTSDTYYRWSRAQNTTGDIYHEWFLGNASTNRSMLFNVKVGNLRVGEWGSAPEINLYDGGGGSAREVFNLFSGTNSFGVIEARGASTGSSQGGQLRLFTADDHDSTINYHRVQVFNDDLRISPNTGSWEHWFRDDGSIEFDGQITAAGDITLNDDNKLAIHSGNYVINAIDFQLAAVTQDNWVNVAELQSGQYTVRVATSGFALYNGAQFSINLPFDSVAEADGTFLGSMGILDTSSGFGELEAVFLEWTSADSANLWLQLQGTASGTGQYTVSIEGTSDVSTNPIVMDGTVTQTDPTLTALVPGIELEGSTSLVEIQNIWLRSNADQIFIRDGSEKARVRSTGFEVFGTLTTDSFTGDGNFSFDAAGNDFVVQDTTLSPTNFIWYDSSADLLYLGSNPGAIVTLRSDVLPFADSTYDLGSSGTRWANLFADIVDTPRVDAGTSDLTIDGNANVYVAIAGANNYVFTGADFYPAASENFGQSGNRWGTGYFDRVDIDGPSSQNALNVVGGSSGNAINATGGISGAALIATGNTGDVAIQTLGGGVGLEMRGTATTQSMLDASTTTLTSGYVADFRSNSSTKTGYVVRVIQDHASSNAIPLLVENHSSGSQVNAVFNTIAGGTADIRIVGDGNASSSGFQLAQEVTSDDAFIWNLATSGDLRFGAGNALAAVVDATTKDWVLEGNMQVKGNTLELTDAAVIYDLGIVRGSDTQTKVEIRAADTLANGPSIELYANSFVTSAGQMVLNANNGIRIADNVLMDGYITEYANSSSWTDGHVLTWDSGNSRFQVEAPSGSGVGGSISDNQVAVGSSTTGDIEGYADFTYTDGVGTGDFDFGTNSVTFHTNGNFDYDGVGTAAHEFKVSGTTEVTIRSEGIMLQSGNGIGFEGSMAAANNLDDYEEGNWTPTLIGTTTTGSCTYTNRVGRYTKIGRVVNAQMQLAWNSHTGSGNLRINGLPFATNSQTRCIGGCMCRNIVWPKTVDGTNIAYVQGGANFIYLYETGDNTGWSIFSIDSAGDIFLTLTYMV